MKAASQRPLPGQAAQPVIALHHVHKAFGENVVLRGVSLDLFPGENVVVLGRSGTGKSVLIKIISGMLQPDSGGVRVLGDEVTMLNDKQLQQLRLKIGFSFQHSALYDSMSVKENLEFPLVRNKRHLTRRERRMAVDRVLDAVGLSQTIHQYPSELSGGQRKRIGIARTLILQPEIMLYDEPTAGLDPITSTEINNLIREVQQRFNTSAIIITHDLTCAKTTGDRVAILLDGHFFREGSFEEVFADRDERVRAFYDYNFTG
ncbi:MAG: ATP-binding cassette domain-containing protein [Bacteroidetes bacterium]|nr:ATP-binding cassette domain-containing protein [Bacteroidota bacterium]MBS1628818.1 ATP-binding cassette domain-containing protein [Bacteroidota bacterium]